MRPSLLLIVLIFIARLAVAQNTQGRNIPFKKLGPDSVALSIGDDYYLIEDSCAFITRYAHFDFKAKAFNGHFRDVINEDEHIVLTEGYYKNNKKNGPFILRYPNGQVYAKGNYKDDMYDGRWETFFEDGKPSLVFEADKNVYKIWDSWLEDGTRQVENGKGEYFAYSALSYWKGNLLNGTPNGNWRLYNEENGAVYATEYFENGKFQDGTSNYSRYTGKSLLTLVFFSFRFINVERLWPSSQLCGTVVSHQSANAVFAHGSNTFMEDLQNAVNTYFSTITYLRDGSRAFKIEGEISPEGKFSNMKSNAEMGRGILYQLKILPALTPASIDGKPVAQKFVMAFTFNDGAYHFNYNLLPLEVK